MLTCGYIIGSAQRIIQFQNGDYFHPDNKKKNQIIFICYNNTLEAISSAMNVYRMCDIIIVSLMMIFCFFFFVGFHICASIRNSCNVLHS